MAGFGVPEKDIANTIRIDPKTLRKHYRQGLHYGHVKANARVAENLYRKATIGEGREAVTAAIFWLKVRAGWEETVVHKIEGQPPVLVLTTHDAKVF